MFAALYPFVSVENIGNNTVVWCIPELDSVGDRGDSWNSSGINKPVFPFTFIPRLLTALWHVCSLLIFFAVFPERWLFLVDVAGVAVVSGYQLLVWDSQLIQHPQCSREGDSS